MVLSPNLVARKDAEWSKCIRQVNFALQLLKAGLEKAHFRMELYENRGYFSQFHVKATISAKGSSKSKSISDGSVTCGFDILRSRCQTLSNRACPYRNNAKKLYQQDAVNYSSYVNTRQCEIPLPLSRVALEFPHFIVGSLYLTLTLTRFDHPSLVLWFPWYAVVCRRHKYNNAGAGFIKKYLKSY